MDKIRLFELLDEYSTQKYHINHGKYFFNHTNQGIIAIYLLGGNEGNVENFVQWYSKYHEDAEEHKVQEDASELVGKEEVEKEVLRLRGLKKNFYFLFSYFENLLKDKYGGDLTRLVYKEYIETQLYRGMVGAALHSLLQIGYGLAVGHSRMVCEGLAYAVYSYLGLKGGQPIADIGKGHKHILAVLDDMKSNVELRNYLQQTYTALQDSIINNGKIMTFISVLYGSRYEDIVKHASEVDIGFPEENEEPVVAKFLDSLIETAVALYVMSEVINDFFFLHGVTSSWSFKQLVLAIHKHMSIEEVCSIAKVFLCGLLAVYLGQRAPGLRSPVQAKKDLQLGERSWEEIIKDTLRGERDEHVHKLVMTCWKADSSNKECRDGGDTNAYKLAAEIALKYEFSF